MTEAEIVATLRLALADVAPDLDVSGISADADLRNDIGLDSMDFLNFVIAVGKRLTVVIPEADYREAATLRKCARYVSEHSVRPAPASPPSP